MRLSKSLCKVVGDVIATTGSHDALNELFRTAGAPGDPPAIAHHSKWKQWLFRAGQTDGVDSLAVLGNVLEEFMDLPPNDDEFSEEVITWEQGRSRVVKALEENGLRYYRFGRVLPHGMPQPEVVEQYKGPAVASKPGKVEELLEIVLRGLRRAMHPLTHRRKGAQALTFTSEYDIQDLLHAMLRPWIADIRPEEFTPSYAGSSTRMDFLLPEYSLVIETKLVRDSTHAKKVGNELIIDIEHYRKHSACKTLWCVVYDPNDYITNAEGLRTDLEGERSMADGKITVRVFVF
jgi:hypothetical protein